MNMVSLKKRNSQRGLAGLAWLIIMTTLSLLGLILGQQFISPRIRVNARPDMNNLAVLPAVQSELAAFYLEVESSPLPGGGPEIGLAGYRLFDDVTGENVSVENLVNDDLVRNFYREVERMDVGSAGPETGVGDFR